MRETRVALSDVNPGEMIVRIGTREIGSRFRGLHDVPAGTRLRGPRGGAYAVTKAGAAELVAVETYGGRPVVQRTAVAVVLRDAETER